MHGCFHQSMHTTVANEEIIPAKRTTLYVFITKCAYLTSSKCNISREKLLYIPLKLSRVKRIHYDLQTLSLVMHQGEIKMEMFQVQLEMVQNY